MLKKRMRLVNAALVIATATTTVSTTSTPAYADPSEVPAIGTKVQVSFQKADTPGTETNLTEAYQEALANPDAGASVKESFIAQTARETGIHYDNAAVEYLKLEQSADVNLIDEKSDAVELVVPQDFHIEKVDVTQEVQASTVDGKPGLSSFAGVSGEIEFDGSDVSTPDGPGFASFVASGSGQYLLKMHGGQLLATWSKSKMKDDKDSRYDYWQYSRKARASNYDISGPNYRLDEFGIKSYAHKDTPLHHWVDWAPATGSVDQNCNTGPIELKVSHLGANAGISYQGCDKYTTYIRDDSPGDMSVNWNHPRLSYPEGPRESAFTWIGARGGDKKFSANDYQYLRLYNTFYETGDLCDSTNTNENC